MKRNCLKAIVTAGGTQEWLDDVRVITNLSTGRFGDAIAQCLVALGFEVTLLGSPVLAQRRVLGDFERRIQFQQFDSYTSLALQLSRLRSNQFHLVFMAAAVSDYSPVRYSGKLSSSADSIHIKMSKNPKILDQLRKYFGAESILVGFKLLSGVSQQHLEAVAQQQCQRANLEYTVANDLQKLSESLHPISLVRADGRVSRHTGDRRSSAQFIVDQIIADNVCLSAMLQQSKGFGAS